MTCLARELLGSDSNVSQELSGLDALNDMSFDELNFGNQDFGSMSLAQVRIARGFEKPFIWKGARGAGRIRLPVTRKDVMTLLCHKQSVVTAIYVNPDEPHWTLLYYVTNFLTQGASRELTQSVRRHS